MYDDESVARYDCEATEEDWLEISYTKRHYIDDEDDFAAPAAVLPHRIRKAAGVPQGTARSENGCTARRLLPSWRGC